MRSASTDMKESFKTLTDALNVMQTQTGEFKDMLGQIPQRFDKLEIVLQESKGNQFNKSDISQGDSISPSDKAAMHFIKTSSLIINFLSYGFVLANKNKQPISLKVLAKIIGTDDAEYCHGATMAMQACGLVNANSIDIVKEVSFEIIDINHVIKKEIQPYLNDYIIQKFSEQPKYLKTLQKSVLEIERLFEPNNPETIALAAE